MLQLLATVAILGSAVPSPAKLAAMLVVWRLGFGPLQRRELLVMALVNLCFGVMNSAALQRGIFVFDHPDLLQMPIWEFLMWGFYTLHVIRFIGGAAPGCRWTHILGAAAVFALPFAVIAQPDRLFVVSAVVLLACLVLFHEVLDLAYAGYMAVLGAIIEYVGVSTGQWHYPGHPLGGVPPWFLTMWAGIGLFTRRLVLPLLGRSPR